MERGGCYCESLWKDPKRMKRWRIPPGFCGLCLACGQPGHSRHSPLPVPGTEAYCDECYDSLANDYDVWRPANPLAYRAVFVEQWRQTQNRDRPGDGRLLTPIRRLFRQLSQAADRFCG